MTILMRSTAVLAAVAAACALLPAAELPSPLTLEVALRAAAARYPSVEAAQQQLEAASAGIRLARTAYLPRADFYAQLNRGTRNNVFGILLPQSNLPSMSGPVIGTNSFTNVWGSAVGTLVSWEPFDFGQRRASVEAAEASRRHAEASVARTQFEVRLAAADAFLTVLAADHTLAAATAGVQRGRILREIAEALAAAGLRPGADASRARAEMAQAETQAIQAKQATAVARAALAQFLDIQPRTIAISPGRLLELPKEEKHEEEAGLDHNPLALEQDAAVREAQAREHSLDRQYRPSFKLEGAVYGRGTGAHPDGSVAGAAGGLGPDTQNWVVGMSVVFPAFDLASLRARREIEAHRERAEQALHHRILTDLKTQRQKAEAQLEGAREVAEHMPAQLEAARDTERQAIARYKAGLGTMAEVADAQRLLTQVEMDQALAVLGVWRAMLGMAAVSGELDEFVERSKSK